MNTKQKTPRTKNINVRATPETIRLLKKLAEFAGESQADVLERLIHQDAVLWKIDKEGNNER